MIKEDYVSFEIAKLLKENGFDAKCYTYYNTRGEVYVFNTGGVAERITNAELRIYSTVIIPECVRPTLSMAMKWLREVHKLHISVDASPIYGKVKDEKGRNTCGLLYWHYMASGEWMNNKYNPQQKAFVVSAKSYEEAVEAALKYSLENLI